VVRCLTNDDLDIKKAHAENRALKLRDRFVFQNKYRASKKFFVRIIKSQTSPGEALNIFSGGTLYDGLQDNNTGCQFFESDPPNLSMALSYEYFSD
jgi:hypothetical protein